MVRQQRVLEAPANRRGKILWGSSIVQSIFFWHGQTVLLFELSVIPGLSRVSAHRAGISEVIQIDVPRQGTFVSGHAELPMA